MINHGILGHYVATASLATGAYETLNNFASTAPENPTVFEYFRRDLRRPAEDAWVVAPSNGFNRIGGSSRGEYGPAFGAEVVLPKQLLAAAMSGGSSRSNFDYEHLLRDNYETPLFAPAIEAPGLGLHRTAEILKLSVDDFHDACARAWRAPTSCRCISRGS